LRTPRALYARAQEPKTLHLLEGQLHAEAVLAHDPEALLAPLLHFFDERLH